MKKLILLLVGIILPVVVLADAAAPSISEYKALIKKSEGVKCENVTIPYNTEVTVVMEYDEDKTTYVNIFYKNNFCTLKMSDISLNDEYKLEDFANEFSLYKYVYKKGAYLYKGPSKIYGKVDGNMELPVGLKLKIEYFDEQWGYVTYNGVSGWVYIYTPKNENLYEETTSLADILDGKIYTLEEIILDDSPYDGKKTDIVIPKGKEVNYKYTYCATFNSMCSIYLTYNGKSGWYGDGDNDYKNIAFMPKDGTLYTLETTDVYEDSNLSKKIGKLEKNKEIKVKYYQYDYGKLYDNASFTKYYLQDNDLTGWVSVNYGDKHPNFLESSNMEYDVYDQALVINPVKVYDSMKKGKEIATIPKDKKIELKYGISTDSGFYFYVNGYNGWILFNVDDLEILETFIERDIDTDNIDNNLEEDKPKMNIKDIALYGVGGAAVISLVSLVTIKLVNKKKEINIK